MMGWIPGRFSGSIALGRAIHPAQRDSPFYHKPIEIESIKK
jgi:hypothetical protein